MQQRCILPSSTSGLLMAVEDLLIWSANHKGTKDTKYLAGNFCVSFCVSFCAAMVVLRGGVQVAHLSSSLGLTATQAQPQSFSPRPQVVINDCFNHLPERHDQRPNPKRKHQID